MNADKTITWAEVRLIVKERNISEQQFIKWLTEKDAEQSPKELLELITHHIYHSTEEHLYAPSHLRSLDYHPNQIHHS